MIRLALLLLLLCLAAPLRAQEAVTRFGTGATEMTIRSTTDAGIFRPVLDAFLEAHPDLSIRYEQWGSNALYALSREECDAGRAGADAVLSSAVQHMVELVNHACGWTWRSARTAELPPSLRWRDQLWGLTREPAVMIYNRDLLAPADVPQSRFALLDLMRQKPGLLRGRIATYDIEASGLGYLFAFSDSLEATTYGALLEGFARAGGVATCCSAELIRAVSDGRFLIAYNVLGSYVSAVAPRNVGVVLPGDYTLFLSRGYMIPARAAQPQAAAALLDFLLGAEGRALMAAAGMIDMSGPSETGLQQSAMRPIQLTPALLVGLDQQRSAQFIALWRAAFGPGEGLPPAP
ncbi:ABC transporter substrate-binding protein [Poseidonocella sp. HB161398]|uniref:ABC transporter substrate-binding protein n=1 Tax=Poseidonocella sp. HB161398 TaxID=2320855 RepID=UPI0011082CDD|nr:extracellular solute-binding protein [Poseidonocella sp. HB161398]